ncbi:hypothetical protein JCM3775_005150 [Rhodotorula graminis]|uniref:ABM domain-containing protein n=1 Tax=Rhodotorula graminis (strain WP1) TaxID=578459 RepID=A0A0P9GH34_RHOGW|nr:uncharacterized protein RHOBADRAFT_65654 [Rhodotorula graminis WP1]KPV72224.1 hypothetical protein RHOBADRAFT_65654 [Rhodotorula graminis WP1]
MSQTPPASGKTVVFARVVAKADKGDELEKLLAAAVASANSDKEPYVLTYRCARHGNEFRLFEEYDQDTGGIEEHKAQEPFQNLLKSGLVADVSIEFFQEIAKA